MKRRKRIISIICIILAVLMVASVFTYIFALSANAVSQSDIDALKDQKEEIQERKIAIQNQINSLEYEQGTVIDKKTILDTKISIIEEEIKNTEARIVEYDEIIAEKADEVEICQEKEAAQFELYKTRIRAMEEEGTMDYLSIILGAKSFSDLLSRIDYISSIMAYDKKVARQLEEAREKLYEAIEAYEQSKVEAEELKVELQSEQEELDIQIEEASALIAEYEAQIADAEAEYQAEEERMSDLNDQISTLTAQYEAQVAAAKAAAAAAAAANGSGSYASISGKGGGTAAGVSSLGDFLWPSYSLRMVTSYCSTTRMHPVYGYVRPHNGIDISGSGAYGSAIIASADGVVITVSYDAGGYGNYVVISHGEGITTRYAHMSSTACSVGDYVVQGETIGYCGSTGASTGPHIHFEIRKDGSVLDPLNYFTGYYVSSSVS